MAKNWFSTGGSKLPKSIIFDAGPRGPHFHKFFEIFHFSTKAPPLFDPKIDPYKWSIENVIPHK
jgi:hypothetical protein